MNKLIQIILFGLICMATACADHDDPELAPINTSNVKISATVDVFPSNMWLNPTEEITIRVSNVNMEAPKGIVLRSISLYENGRQLLDKPFSGETLEFKVPLSYMKGRLNFSIVGNLIQKNYRDAQILIEDNIQRIVFSETPTIDCKARLNVTVKSRSTSGEEFTQQFDVESVEGLLTIPQEKLYWTPASGDAAVIDLTLSGSAEAWSPNSTLDCAISRIYWGMNYPNDRTLKLTIPNEYGSLNNKKLSLYVTATYYGTTENITVQPQHINILYDVRESK